MVIGDIVLKVLSTRRSLEDLVTRDNGFRAI